MGEYPASYTKARTETGLVMKFEMLSTQTVYRLLTPPEQDTELFKFYSYDNYPLSSLAILQGNCPVIARILSL